MSNASIDLFDDPTWLSHVPVRQPTADPRHLTLYCSMVPIGLLMSSMALPWFTSAETPSWTPFSRWLNLGWSPGTLNWAYLLLGLSAGVAIGIAVAVRSGGRFGMTVLLLAATVLLVVTLLEASANLSVDAGPNLHADYGAFIGVSAAVLLWIGLAVGPHLKFRR